MVPICIGFGASWSCFGVVFDALAINKTAGHPAGGHVTNCTDYFDADIAGLGVVFSFVASVVLTAAASMMAMLIDHYLGNDGSILPRRVQKTISSIRRERLCIWRTVLDRLIVGFADQQLVSGFALLITAWLKLTPKNLKNAVRGDYDWITSIPSATFSLVVFLCCGSSSAHLACLMTLRRYLTEHKTTARMRVALVALFSMLLTGTIMFASSFNSWVMFIAKDIIASMPTTRTELGPQTALFVTVLLIPVSFMLWIFWICTLQLLPKRRDQVHKWLSSKITRRLRKILGLNTIWSIVARPLSDNIRRRLARVIRFLFWTPIIGHPLLVFVLQLLLATLSTIWVFLQRFISPPPRLTKRYAVCSMHQSSMGSETWSFGQMLPMLLLVLPLLSAFETYIEERDSAARTASRQGHGAALSATDPLELSLLSPAFPDSQSYGPNQPVFRGSYQRVPSDTSIPRYQHR